VLLKIFSEVSSLLDWMYCYYISLEKVSLYRTALKMSYKV